MAKKVYTIFAPSTQEVRHIGPLSGVWLPCGFSSHDVGVGFGFRQLVNTPGGVSGAASGNS